MVEADAWVLACRWLGVPTPWVTSRVSLDDSAPSAWWKRRIRTWANAHTTAIVANSRLVRDRVHQNETVPRHVKLLRIPNGVDLVAMAQARPRKLREEIPELRAATHRPQQPPVPPVHDRPDPHPQQNLSIETPRRQ
jgi:hypothetical protein